MGEGKIPWFCDGAAGLEFFGSPVLYIAAVAVGFSLVGLLGGCHGRLLSTVSSSQFSSIPSSSSSSVRVAAGGFVAGRWISVMVLGGWGPRISS